MQDTHRSPPYPGPAWRVDDRADPASADAAESDAGDASAHHAEDHHFQYPTVVPVARTSPAATSQW